MNGIHDMGGMHGFGPVDPDDDDPFHHEWEQRAHAIMYVLGSHQLWTTDELRYLREQLHPVTYLRMGYWEQRLVPLELALVDRGIIDEGAVDERMTELAEGDEVTRTDPELTERARESIMSNSSFEREPKPAQFDTGDSVVVRNMHPDGHTRVPRYVRRARGVVTDFHGTQMYPDAAAEKTDVGEPLYSVRFTAREVWGDDHSESDTIVLQLFQPYLKAP